MKADNNHNDQPLASNRAIVTVEWQDLRQLKCGQVAYNVILPYPFLLLSWWFASQSWYVMAGGASYLFFAAAFRQAHDGYHHSLGTNKRTTTTILLLLSVLLMTSLHSIRATHMAHHRDPLGASDIEGRLAKGSWWQALLGGITYRLDIYRQGLRLSSRRNQTLAWFEFGLIALVGLASVLVNVSAIPALALLAQVLMYHLLTMMLANASVGIIAVWGVHHDCEETIARTERNPWVNLLTFNLLYHVEHHLFPAVPSNHLPKLAKRLDVVAPQLTKARVLPSMTTVKGSINNYWNKIKGSYLDHNDDSECPIRKRFV